MNKYLRLFCVFLLFVALALVRFFESEIFYDPLLEFFKTEYITAEPPIFDFERLLLNTAFRYWLNSFLSLLIIYIAFWNKNTLKFAALLYFLLFLLLFPAFMLLLMHLEQENYLLLFYVRRFLIQPLLVLLLLPAFYYQKMKKG